MPPEIKDRYHLSLPAYPGTDMCVKLPNSSLPSALDVANMRGEYATTSGGLDESSVLKVCYCASIFYGMC